MARATQLLTTLDHDVSGLEADQDDERKRIERDWQHQQEAVDLATDRLARMHSHARQIAAHKARLAEFEVAANPLVPPRPPDEVTVDSFMELMARIDVELRAAQGITGAIRLPQIALLLNEAGAAMKRLAESADQTRQQLLERTEAELNTEGKEAMASFEIGTGILERDLALLDRSLPVTARSWTSSPWITWEPPEVPAGWVRLGTLTNTRLPTAPIPYLLPTTCGPGLVLEGGAHRDMALDGVRSLVLRLIAALPPGMAQFSFIDPKGLGESIAPFLALGDYDQALVGRGALVIDSEIEAHLEGVTRHIERVISQCLQGRHPTLDDYHDAVGGHRRAVPVRGRARPPERAHRPLGRAAAGHRRDRAALRGHDHRAAGAEDRQLHPGRAGPARHADDQEHRGRPGGDDQDVGSPGPFVPDVPAAARPRRCRTPPTRAPSASPPARSTNGC